MPLEESFTDPARGQVISDRVRELRKPLYRGQKVLVFFTDRDMNAEEPGRPFVFSSWYRYTSGLGVSVVSTARLDPRFFGEPADPGLARERLRKVVTKKLGTLYYGLPESEDPNSVMYRQMWGLDAFDSAGEGF